jgi:DNA anti-recombination protein RmuC
MNAARLARNLVADGIDRALAEPLAEHLADEIERTVATREHVEMVVNTVVTREVQQLRGEMHEEFRRSEMRISDRLDSFQSEMTRRLDGFQTQMNHRMDAFQAQVTQRLDSQTRWLATSLIALFVAVLANLLKDILL